MYRTRWTRGSGKLTFVDGAPSDETVEKVYDNLDFIQALEAYMNGYQLASLKAMHKGLLAAGVEDNGGCSSSRV